MKQQLFEQRYKDSWQQFAESVKQLEAKSEPLSGKWYVNFVSQYRQICHLQSIAAQRNYSRILVDELNNLVSQGHRLLYHRRTHFGYDAIKFIFADFPALLRKEAKVFWLSTAALYLPLLLMFIGVQFKPELIYSVFNSAQVAEFEAMYAPENKVLGEARDAETDLMMFGYYIENNISVAFRAFALGILLGVGSLFVLIFNGIFIGAIAGHLLKLGYTDTFFPFVIGHGSFELTAIVIAGAAGLKLGYSLIAPKNMTRIESLRKASHGAVKLMYGVVLMLVVAAFIEAFWSANGLLPPVVKYSVGAGLWLLVIVYLVLLGRRRAA